MNESGNINYEKTDHKPYSRHIWACLTTLILSKRATCNKKHVGALFLNDRYDILSIGFNSSPKGMKKCTEEGHLIEYGHCVRNLHAEQMAISSAARNGVSLKDSIVYLNWCPCRPCAMMLINVGVKGIYLQETNYHKALDILKASSIEITYWI